MEILTLHFNLSENDPTKTYRIHGHGSKQVLQSYADNPEKLEEHKQVNSALALLLKEHENKITHFVEDMKLPKDSITRLSVVTDSANEDDILPDLISVHNHIPQHALKKTYINKGHTNSPTPLIVNHLALDTSKITPQNFADVHSNSALIIKPPYAVAQSVVTSHPEIGSINVGVASHIFTTYLQDRSSFTNLINYISSSPQGGDNPWSVKTYAIKADPNTGEISPAEPTLRKFKDGKIVNWPTIIDPKDPDSRIPVIPQYELTDESTGAENGGIMAAATPVIYSVLKQTKNDKKLSGSIWTRSHGKISETKSNVSPSSAKKSVSPSAEITNSALAVPAPLTSIVEINSDQWSVKYNSSKTYGLDLYAEDLTIENNIISFPVKNWPSRYLSVYIEYQHEDGTPIPWSVLKTSKEGSDLVQPNGYVSEAFRLVFNRKDDSSTKLFWGMISSGNSVLGVPFPTNETDIKFQWPHDKNGNEIASKAKIYVGGLGAINGFSDWDTDVDLAGLIATGIINYGVIAASMGFTVAVVGPLKKILVKKDLVYGILALAIPLGLTAFIVASVFWKSGTAKYILAKMASFVVGIIFGVAIKVAEQYQAVIEELIIAFIANLTGQEALEEVPYVGWALKAASVAGDVASLAATTTECVLSPATYELQVQPTMDLTISISPDPKHGTLHQAPIWPLVADHWEIKLKYPKYSASKTENWNGGTTYIKTGPMPGQHDAPIEVTFENVPTGGQIEMTSHIYSKDNWLAGQWHSGPKSATTVDDSGQLYYAGSIVEKLVPLNPTTSYSEKQRLGFDAKSNKHVWVATTFSISADFGKELNESTISKSLYAAFASNGVFLPKMSLLSLETLIPDNKWEISAFKVFLPTYTCTRTEIYSSDGTVQYELEVIESSRPAPPLPNPKTVCDTSGVNHNLCQLVDTTINNKAYQLGYAWRASGMNLPLDESNSSPKNTQMFNMQSISTLNEPEDLIIQSDVGFSEMPFIAYNQFGLTPLFSLDFATFGSVLNNADKQLIPNAIIQIFAKHKYTIGDGVNVDVIKKDQEWRFEDTSGQILFDLLYTTEVVKGVRKPIINVFNYLVPEKTNFYMDPRPGPAGNYHLRGVSFNGGLPGSYKFDNDFDESKANSWGAFPIGDLKSSIYKVAIHPAGYAIAIDYSLDKIWALPLPHEAVTMKNAPLAMPLSGSGDLEGLINLPKAMTIASDGRIIILEEGNSRLQSFDVNGNSVAVFNGTFKAELPNTLIATLDTPELPLSVEMMKAYQSVIESSSLRQPIIQVFDDTPIADLDKEIVGEKLLDYFKNNYLELPASVNDIEVSVNVSGISWFVKDKVTEIVFDVRWDKDLFSLSIFYAPRLKAEIVAKSKIWILRDTMNSLTFRITAGDAQSIPLTMQQLISYAPLRSIKDKTIEYLDIAIEDKGFIYVLYAVSPGNIASQYMLDIYNPDGSLLLDNPVTGMAAAKMSVDQWRTLWTLNYETFFGPNDRTEPTVSGWIPSTPEGPKPN